MYWSVLPFTTIMNIICFVENKSTHITQTNPHKEGVIKISYHVYI